MNKIKVGVFGGDRGFTMIKQLLKSKDATLVAVCDKYEPLLERVKNAAAEVGMEVALYNNFEDFLKHDMDAVVLANYAHEHATFAIRCLEAGKHVMSEVLPAETPAQAVALVEAVEKSGLVYTYAENYCYMRDPFEMRLRYERGDIGKAIYCEASYIHDCSSCWHSITYGDPNHWRNHMYPTFYCTHSVGPMLSITGLRPVQVIGFENPLNTTEKQKNIGLVRTAGIEMITLENGAVFRSIHGPLKREPSNCTFTVYGETGMLSDHKEDGKLTVYKESPEADVYCKGETESYTPAVDICREEAELSGHGGSDFYTVHFFIEKILGRPDGKWAIDVYSAIDMGLCGILAWRSVLAGNVPMAIPNFRNPEEREAWRNDNACTNPDIAGDDLLPVSSFEMPEFDSGIYAKLRNQWLNKD